MKTHRNILILSFLIFMISLILTLILSQYDKSFQIVLSCFGSSFIAFVLELPNYISLKNENKNKLYYSLTEIKNQILLFENGIRDQYKYNSINVNFFVGYTNKIAGALNILKSFDLNYYFFRNKNTKVTAFINSINNSYSNLHLSTLKFNVSLTQKQYNHALENDNILVTVNEVNNELNLINNMCDELLSILDETADILLNKKQKNDWIINNQEIQTTINNSNIVNN